MTTPGVQLAIDNELALLTPAVRGNPSEVAALRQARRSSLWRLAAGSWQLLCHQGTPTNNQ